MRGALGMRCGRFESAVTFAVCTSHTAVRQLSTKWNIPPFYLNVINCKHLPTVAYKITIELKEKKMTRDELKQASRYLSEALTKMGIDHAVECRMDKLKSFHITKNFLKQKHEL
jgi:hypothetical protein